MMKEIISLNSLFPYDLNMNSLKSFYRDKIILITGAASGIGKRFAEKVYQLSEPTLILWDRNPAILTELKQQLNTPSNIYTADIDISDPERIQAEADNLIEHNLIPDIVINCAGIVIGKNFHQHTQDDIERTIQINTTGSMWVAHAFLNEMIQRSSGHIVNLGSASGYIGNPRMSVYAASKWAVLGWSESLRIEMNQLKTGVSVTTVIPSYINTGMFDGVKAPLFTPILETDDLVDHMLYGIFKKKKEIKAPFIVHFVPFLKSILPKSFFDWLAGSVLGVYTSMNSFQGRKPKSS